MTGTLKGYDQLMNLVMDDVVEEFEGESFFNWSMVKTTQSPSEQPLEIVAKEKQRLVRDELTSRRGQTNKNIRPSCPSRSQYRSYQPNRWIGRSVMFNIGLIPS